MPGFAGGHREVDLGNGRKLVFTSEAIEVFGDSPPVFPPISNAIGAGGPGRIPLSAVRRASFAAARAYPALALCVAGTLGAALIPYLVVRALALVLVGVGIWLFLRARTWVVRFEQSSGEPAVLVLGGGAPGSPRGVKAQSVWADLRDELQRRGIEVRR